MNSDRPERNTLELKILPNSMEVNPLLMSTAYRMWGESEDIRNKESLETEKKQKEFLIALIDYWMSIGIVVPMELFDKQEIKQDNFKPNPSCLTVLEVLEGFKNQDATDAVLIKAINEIEQKVLPKRENNSVEHTQNNQYLILFKSVWGEGVPAYLSRIMQRREALDLLDLIELWKPSLKLMDIKTNEDRKAAEESIFHEIENVFEGIKAKLFKDKAENFCLKELETNSITELQNLWRKENGFTLKSWELKHKAYIKLMLIYGIMKVIGTINFNQKRQRKRTIQRLFEKYIYAENNITEVSLKEIVSVAMKDIKHFLSDTREPDPRIIRDHVRVRWDVVMPEGVLETNDIDAIRDYVVEDIARILAIIGTSYSFDRLRNSWIKKGINHNSGSKHRAFQFTVYPLNDIRYKDEELKKPDDPNQVKFAEIIEPITKSEENESQEQSPFFENGIVIEEMKKAQHASNENEIILKCPETFPFEVQLVAQLTPEERKKDNEDYENKKVQELRNLLGCDVKFEDFVDHLAELFIKQVKMPEEKAGGISDLSEKERLGIIFLKILANDDAETIKYLKTAYADKKESVIKKFNKAKRTITNYWDSKMKVFMQDKISILSNICVYTTKEIKNNIKFIDNYLKPEEISQAFDTVQEVISVLHQLDADLKELPPYNIPLIKAKIRDLNQLQAKIALEDPNLGLRFSKVINQMYEYYFVHYEKIDLETLILSAEEGLHNLFR
jgi:hypothetical protein